MPIEKKNKDDKATWNFTNIFAFTLGNICLLYLCLAPYILTRTETKDNTMLAQINTGIIGILTVIIAYYFGSSMSSSRQQQQITEMHKTATEVALNKTNTGDTSEQKIDKGVKIGELKAALEKLDPDSDDAKIILDQLKELEKQS